YTFSVLILFISLLYGFAYYLINRGIGLRN
ncbi:ABC transporter permease, partial [Testudinibacter sp. TR-2022]